MPLLIFLYLAFATFGATYLYDIGYLTIPNYHKYGPRGQLQVYFAIYIVAFYLAARFHRIRSGFILQRQASYNFFLKDNFIIFHLLLIILILVTLDNFFYMLVENLSARHAPGSFLALCILLAGCLQVFYLVNSSIKWKFIYIILIIFFCTIYYASGSSRSGSLIFLALTLSYLVRKKYLYSLISAYFFIAYLDASLGTRLDGANVYEFWEAFVYACLELKPLGYVPVLIRFTFSGSTTTLLALSDPGALTLKSFSDFLLYLSPIPSSMLPKQLFDASSLNSVIGVKGTSFGLNSDIIAEPVMRLGFWGAIVAPYVLVLLFKATENLIGFAGLGENPIIMGLYTLCLLFFFLGGMQFTMRAASRPLVYFATFLLLYLILKRVKLGFR